MPCCGSGGGANSLRDASCCRLQASAPLSPLSQPVRVVTPPPTAAVLSAPADLPSEPVPAPRTVELPPALPPPLHEGIGLYTLNATFLI